MTQTNFYDYLNNNEFSKRVLDLGTGDGRFIYKSALEDEKTLFIGIDPAPNYKEYQREINRKRLKNAFLIQNSVEKMEFPENFFDEIYINLPWGNLLKYTVKVDLDIFEKLSKILKNEGLIKIVFGFDPTFEESQVKRLNLRDMTENEMEFLKASLSKIPSLTLKSFEILNKKDLKSFNTSWAKKLSFGSDRNFIKIILQKI